MSRPSKQRRICDEPMCRVFGPHNSGKMNDTKDVENSDVVSMTVDEYESIRLIDLEALSQEECANRMNVARTTAQAIYASARTKLADCIVNGKTLQIAGGNYVVCDGSAGCSESCKHS